LKMMIGFSIVNSYLRTIHKSDIEYDGCDLWG